MKLISILIIAFLLTSCDKYDLEGEKAIFIGIWEWSYSDGSYIDLGGGFVVTNQITPTDMNKTFQIEFRGNGKYLLKDKDGVVHREKAKFTTWYKDTVNDRYRFCIYVNEESKLQGYIWDDTMLLYQYSPPFYFPSFDNDGVYTSYDSYFVRQ